MRIEVHDGDGDGDSADGSPSIMSEMMAMLILRGRSDTVRFRASDQEQLRRIFPTGFALVAFGDTSTGEIGLKLLGRESMPMLEQIRDEMDDGQTATLERLFAAGAAGEPDDGGGD